MLIYCFLISYIVVKSIKMVESELDNITSNEEIVDYYEVNRVNLTDMMPVIIFQAQNKDLLNYVEFTVEQELAYSPQHIKKFRKC